MFKKILVATDGSDRAYAAVEYALQLAKDAGAEVVGLYVVDLTSLPPAGEVTVPPSPATVEYEALKLLEVVVKGAKEHGIEANVQVEFGKPAEEIVRKAEREGVDLIVLSSTGKGVDRFLLGSVSEGVIRRAKCPVLVVPFSGPCTL